MIKRRASLPSFNFRFVQEQESISIAKKDKTLITVSDLFSRLKNLFFSAFYGNTGIVFFEPDLAAAARSTQCPNFRGLFSHFVKYEAQKVNMNSNKARMVTSYFPRAQVRVA